MLRTDFYSGIILKINQAARAEQKLRKTLFSKIVNDKAGQQELDELDSKNSNLIKEIVEKIGLPTISKVGKQASYNAWLIVQHSKDLPFQKRYLNLLEANKNDVDKCNIAYLEDRILRHEGKPQKYGTQILFNPLSRKHELQKTSNPKQLDLRREEFGLEPIRDYLDRADKFYSNEFLI